MIDDKTTALPVKQLDSVTGAIVENVDNTIRRIEIIAAYQLGQAKNTLTHVYWSATNPKNICFVEYKHKVFRAKVVKLEAHTKAAKVGCLLCFLLSLIKLLVLIDCTYEIQLAVHI